MTNVISLSEARAKRATREPWMKRAEAARYLGCSVSWIKLREKDAGLPCCLVAGTKLYRRSELDAWLEARRQA